HIENKQIEFVNPLFANIFEVVKRDLCSFEGERIDSAQVLKVFRSHFKCLERRHRKEIYFLEARAAIVERKVRDAMVLADYLASHPYFLNQRIALERVFVQSASKLGFLRRKRSNNLVVLRLSQRRGTSVNRLTGCVYRRLLRTV